MARSRGKQQVPRRALSAAGRSPSGMPAAHGEGGAPIRQHGRPLDQPGRRLLNGKTSRLPHPGGASGAAPDRCAFDG